MRTRQQRVTRLLLVLTLAAVVPATSCRKESDQQDAQYAQQQYPQQYQQQYPQQQYPQQQYPQGNTQPAQQQTISGVPCGTDADPQCVFGRCIGGKCGGCITQDHCKPGSSCAQTPLGMKCMPAGLPGTQ